MKQEQIEQIAAAWDNHTAQAITDAFAEQFNKRKKPSFNYNIIIGFVGIIVLILALFAANWKLNSAVNSIEDSNATLIPVIQAVDSNVMGLQEGVNAINDGIADIDASIGEVKESVSKIPTKPVVIKQAPKNVNKAYNECVKSVMNKNYTPEVAKQWLEVCKMYLK